MTKPESPSELFATLVQAIASAHTGDVRQLLTDHPILARHKAAVGATRKSAGEFYLKGIEHYLYEGDTALHVAAAAAAYGEAVAVQLVAKGAEVRAKNRHSQEPLHYAVLGTPGSLRWNPNAQTATIRLLSKAGADVVPIISASVSWLIFAMIGSGRPSLPKFARSRRVRASRFSLELNN
jgi:hypothetical protein